jgi:hypothetical protein
MAPSGNAEVQAILNKYVALKTMVKSVFLSVLLSELCLVSSSMFVRHSWPNDRAHQKYMHAFSADRDHAMCNIQNRTIPVVQLIHSQKNVHNNFARLKE